MIIIFIITFILYSFFTKIYEKFSKTKCLFQNHIHRNLYRLGDIIRDPSSIWISENNRTQIKLSFPNTIGVKYMKII